MTSGEDLAIYARKELPEAKIIILTMFNESFRIHNIIKTINPEGFLIKSDIESSDLITTFKNVINNKSFYSETIITLMKQNMSNTYMLDDNDIILLHEMSNGAKMKDLLEKIPLSKSGIEKKKTLLKEKFKTKEDRDLIIKAKQKGYI